MKIIRNAKLSVSNECIPYTNYFANEKVEVNGKPIQLNMELGKAITMMLFSKFSVGEIDGQLFVEFSNIDNSEKYRAKFLRNEDIATLQINGNVTDNSTLIFPIALHSTIFNDEILDLFKSLKEEKKEMLDENCKVKFANLFQEIYLNGRNLEVTVDDVDIAMVHELDKNHTEIFCENNFKTVKAPVSEKKVLPIDFGRELTEKEIACIPHYNLAKMFIPKIVRNIAYSISKGAKSSFFYGPAGIGKTTATDIICQLANLPMKAIVNCTNELDQYVLAKWIPQGETFVLKRSAVTDAIENGGAVVFEELNFGNPKHMSFLFSILDQRNLVVLDDGSVIKVHPAFRFFATFNPSYSGTNPVNKALLRRFNTGMFFEEMSDEQLHTIIDEYVSFDTASRMILVYNKMREKLIIEQREEFIVSPRDLIAWAKAIKYSDVFEAANSTIVGCALDDKEFRTWIKDIVDMTFEVSNSIKETTVQKMKSFETISPEKKALIPFMDKALYKRIPEAIAIEKQLSDGTATSAIFFGGTGTGKSTLCDCICDDIGCPVIAVVNCTSSLDRYILGKWTPSGTGFVFKKSKVTEAIENGGAVFFEEINFGDPRCMSFLHSMMDNRKFVELDDGSVIKVHPDFRMFATMNPGYDGTQMLNPALYNRFNIKLYVGELEVASIKNFITSTYGTSNEDFDIMLSVYNAVKSKIVEEEREVAIAPDMIKNWARELSNGFDIFESSEMTIVNIALDDNEFRNWIKQIVDAVVARKANERN